MAPLMKNAEENPDVELGQLPSHSNGLIVHAKEPDENCLNRPGIHLHSVPIILKVS